MNPFILLVVQPAKFLGLFPGAVKYHFVSSWGVFKHVRWYQRAKREKAGN